MFGKVSRSLYAAAFFAAAVAVLLIQIVGHTAPVPASLQFAKGFTLTGNYAVGNVNLTEQANPVGLDGFATGTIHMTGVPDNAEVVAA